MTNARIHFLIFIGAAITILFVMSFTDLGKHNYPEGILLLAAGGGLSFVFFRKRKAALAIVGLTFILVSAGVTAPFHPTVVGFLLTFGSAAGLYLIALWDKRRNPSSTAKDWKKLFDNDPGADLGG